VVKRRNAANSGWIAEDTIDETFLVSRASNTMLDTSDRNKCFRATSNFTQTLDAVATLGDGWSCDYLIASGVTITFDPNSSEQIDGASTLAVAGPAAFRIFCDGSAFRTTYVSAAVVAATQAEQETASSTAVFVSPGRQQYHPSAAKGWAVVTFSGSTPTLAANYNVFGITDNGVGDITITWDVDFSTANYAMGMMVGDFTTVQSLRGAMINSTGSVTAGAVRLVIGHSTAEDPSRFTVIAFGDQ